MKAIVASLCLFFLIQLDAQTLSDYLPTNIQYDPDIPTPQEVLGYEVGEWHVSHDQLVYYMKALDAASDRISILEYARTYENRPLMVLIITSSENHDNLEGIRSAHVSLSDPSRNESASDKKLVHWMGYSVHGNEASGSNAALLTAYYLAAGQGQEIDKILDDVVILLDPSFNPDGLQRFSTWVNMHKSNNLVADPNSREFDEVWPGGRTNHYWFDLNRDWMPVQHPESRGRIELFHKWKPNVLTDHHEMGSNSTFFFQPGIPSRKFPLTPKSNVDLTQQIATYHAEMLDSIGSFYYSRESFDDFYIGKGSTYPDLNGSIGILFEQASARGHLRENQFGELSFPFAIRNHFVTSLSTLKAAHALKSELLSHQQNFYKKAINEAVSDPIKAFVFGASNDPVKAYHLAELIRRHGIEVNQVKGRIQKGGMSFEEGGFLVHTTQPQYRLIKAMFETRTSFQDSLFYDVSTWTLPLAFNLEYAALGAKDFLPSNKGAVFSISDFPEGIVPESSNYAYAFESSGYYAHRAVNRLLKESVIVEVAHNEHVSTNRTLPVGSIIIPVGMQRHKQDKIDSLVKVIASKDGINVYGLETGLAIAGSDLGSRQMEVIEKPEIAVLVGDGVSSYEAGEVWHLLDQRMEMKVTLLPVTAVNNTDINRYTRLVFPHGSYGSIEGSGTDRIKEWVKNGGVIIAWKRGGKWLADQGISSARFKSIKPDTVGYKKYIDLDQIQGAQVIGGSIFEVTLDMGHPLLYGLSGTKMPVFRNHSYLLEKAKNPYANPMVYTSSPLLSGYISEEKLELVRNTPAVTVSKYGKGKIITFADNPNFRAFWYGTNKLFLNALFFGSTIDPSAAE